MKLEVLGLVLQFVKSKKALGWEWAAVGIPAGLQAASPSPLFLVHNAGLPPTAELASKSGLGNPLNLFRGIQSEMGMFSTFNINLIIMLLHF